MRYAWPLLVKKRAMLKHESEPLSIRETLPGIRKLCMREEGGGERGGTASRTEEERGGRIEARSEG